MRKKLHSALTQHKKIGVVVQRSRIKKRRDFSFAGEKYCFSIDIGLVVCNDVPHSFCFFPVNILIAR